MTVKTCGHEKIHYTVVLACYGRILTPFLIFKRKKHYIKKEYLMVFYVPVCPKDWMNEGEMKLWLHKVWSKNSIRLSKKPALVLWDQFQAHVKKVVEELKTELVIYSTH